MNAIERDARKTREERRKMKNDDLKRTELEEGLQISYFSTYAAGVQMMNS